MYRMHIFIPASELTNGNAIAKNVFLDTGEDKTFGVIQLRAIGAMTTSPTHYACNGLVTENQRSKLLKALSSPGIQAIFYRLNLETEILEASNSPTAIAGQAWDWDKSLTDMKLESIPSVLAV